MKTISSNCILLLLCVYFFTCSETEAVCDIEKTKRFVKISQDGLAELNPFKTTTVTSSPIFCSFNCGREDLCVSFVYLKQRTTENCLLSTEPNGGSSNEDSETYVIASVPSEACANHQCPTWKKCVACSDDTYDCACLAPWTSGELCENLNPDYNLDLLPWKPGSGSGIMNVDIAFDQAWCVSNALSVFIDINGVWVKVLGGLSQLSVGENGLKGVHGPTGSIYTRIGITNENPSGTQWYHHAGILHQITSGSAGVTWGINSAIAKMFYYVVANGEWIVMSGSYKWCSCGKFGCWALHLATGAASFRTGVTQANPRGDSWVAAGGSFKMIDTGVRGDVYAVDDAGQVYIREGVTEHHPQGTKWSTFGNLACNHISVGYNSILAVGSDQNEYRLNAV